MHKKHAKDGLALVTVSTDDLSDTPDPVELKASILKYLNKQGADCTNLLLDEKFEFWRNKLGFDLSPCYFVFDRRGKWTKFNDPPIDYGAMDRLVEELLKEK